MKRNNNQVSGFDSSGPRKENVIRQSRDSAELPPGILNRESNVDPEDEEILVGANVDFGQSTTSRNKIRGLEEVRQKSFESVAMLLLFAMPFCLQSNFDIADSMQKQRVDGRPLR